MLIRRQVLEHWTHRRLRAATLGLLLAIPATQVVAQTQSLQAWPEVDTYLSLNSDVRISFFAAATREDRQGRVQRLVRISISILSRW